jgi:hypothetical protein
VGRARTARASCAVVVLTTLLGLPSATRAGGFVINGSGGLDGPTVFNRSYSYFFADGVNPRQMNPITNGTFWQTNLRDTPEGDLHSLNVTIQHVAGFPTVGPLFQFNFNNLIQPAAGTVTVTGQAQQANHGTDFDIARVSVNLQGGAEPVGQVVTRGSHPTGRVIVSPGSNFSWSLLNPAGSPALTITGVTPSYRFPDMTFGVGPTVAAGTVLPAGRGTNGPLAATLVDPVHGVGVLTDYELDATGSPTSHTTLAFLGKVNGTPSELDIDAATSIFTDSGTFLAPMFTHASSSDLYVAVDLTQWLSAPASFMPNPGDTFTVGSDGTNPMLPGFLFSTTPITMAPGGGFMTTSPDAGDTVIDRATIDGEIPEPTSLIPSGTGLLILLGYRRCTRRGNRDGKDRSPRAESPEVFRLRSGPSA